MPKPPVCVKIYASMKVYQSSEGFHAHFDDEQQENDLVCLQIIRDIHNIFVGTLELEVLLLSVTSTKDSLKQRAH